MVTAVTNLGRSGLSDWIIQRVSAVVLAAYTIFICTFLLVTPDLTYELWRELFSELWMRVFSLLALLSIAAHGWIGLWNVITDYLTTRLLGSPALPLRMVILGIYGLITISYLVWGIEILWGLK